MQLFCINMYLCHEPISSIPAYLNGLALNYLFLKLETYNSNHLLKYKEKTKESFPYLSWDIIYHNQKAC